MRKKEITFKFIEEGYEGGGLRLCHGSLFRWFDFPSKSSSITMVISDKPSAQAVKVEDNESGSMRLYVYTLGGRRENQLVWGPVKTMLKKFGFPCYVSLKY